MPDESPWKGDVNEAVVEEWVDETTPFDRVREVVRTTAEPRYAREIADQARVSEPTARKHLQVLAEAGIAESIESVRGMRYKRSRQVVAMSRIADIHANLTREELANGIRDIREQIRSYQEEYDATDPDDLTFRLDDDQVGWETVTEWRALERNLNVAKAALALYDFDPDGGDRGASNDGNRGSFARKQNGEVTA